MGQSQLVRRFVTNDKLNYLSAKERKKTYKTGKLDNTINIHHIIPKIVNAKLSKQFSNLIPLKISHHHRVHEADRLRTLDRLRTGVNKHKDLKYYIDLIRDTVGSKDKKYKACIIETLDNIINKPKMTIIDKHYGARK